MLDIGVHLLAEVGYLRNSVFLDLVLAEAGFLWDSVFLDLNSSTSLSGFLYFWVSLLPECFVISGVRFFPEIPEDFCEMWRRREKRTLTRSWHCWDISDISENITFNYDFSFSRRLNSIEIQNWTFNNVRDVDVFF